MTTLKGSGENRNAICKLITEQDFRSFQSEKTFPGLLPEGYNPLVRSIGLHRNFAT